MLTHLAASVSRVFCKSRALLLLLVCLRCAVCAVACSQTEPGLEQIPALANLCIPEKVQNRNFTQIWKISEYFLYLKILTFKKTINLIMLLYSVVAKIIGTLVFSSKSVISMFCCSVSEGNISLYFQAFILLLIVIIQWDFCLTTVSAPHRDLIWSSSSLSGITWRNRTNWDRLNPEELWQRLQDASRNLPVKLPEKLCTSAPRAKAALNAKVGHTKCWFNLVNRS